MLDPVREGWQFAVTGAPHRSVTDVSASFCTHYAKDSASLTNFKSTNPMLVTQSKLTATAQTIVAAGRMRSGNMLFRLPRFGFRTRGSEN